MESTIKTSGFSSSTDSSTSPRQVSDSTYRLSDCTPRRSARSLSWRGDSSPETYRILAVSLSFPQICSISVDLPMPGAPPTSTSEPCTAPPPSTRSSSPMPVGKRISCAVSSSAIGCALARSARLRPPVFAFAPSPTACSTSVFHAPQLGQRPAHLGVSLPHSVQKNTLFAFAIL